MTDIYIDRKEVPVEIPPYNWYEMGSIRNVPEDEQNSFCDTPIYQILPVKYLIKIFRNNNLRFNNILNTWEDPYELFFLKQDIEVEGMTNFRYQDQLINRYFGQCWSLNRDSDAMWRIYSHDKESVRIKTTVIKLIKVLEQTRGMLYTGPLFGKVLYYNNQQLSEWMNNSLKGGSGNILQAFSDSLFIKRCEFAHENEMRFIIQTSKESKDYKDCMIHDGYVDMHVDPFSFIDEIALDPRLSDEDFGDRKSLLSSMTSNIPICKSDFYAFHSEKYTIKETPIHIKAIIHEKKQE